MRTKLTLNEDVADFLKMRDRSDGRPLNQALNDVSGRGMTPNPEESEVPKFQIIPNHSGLASGIDPLRLNQLNDELDVEEFTAESEH